MAYVGAHGVTRRDREERYVNTIPPEEWPAGWMNSVLRRLECVLDRPGNITMQDVADALDYGPSQFSPREKTKFRRLTSAFHTSMAKADENCKRGEHRYRKGRCVHCKTTKLKVVE